MENRALLESTEDLLEYTEEMVTQSMVPPLVPPALSDSELYHVFLSSSSTDYEWTQSLMEQLETRGLRVCFHERDFTPGRTILENMSDCISQSQKVLLVLSPDFVRSRWCLLEANMSLFRDCLLRKPIVPVLLRHVSIPLHLCHLTYLEVEHPTFTQQLLKVLCTTNDQLQGSTVVPYQSPSIYNGKTLQPLIAVNEEGLDKWECGVWGDMEVPDQLRLIIREPQRYLQAIGIMNTVYREKVRFRSLWTKVLFVIGAIIFFSSSSGAIGLLIAFTIIDKSSRALKIVFIFVVAAILIWAYLKICLFKKNEVKRILGELQKAAGHANTLLLEEKVLLGAESRSKIFVVYVSVDGCRRELGPEQGEDEQMFHKALLQFSSDYTCCLAKRHFPFAAPTEPGHLEGGVCFCQYVLQMRTMEPPRTFNCC